MRISDWSSDVCSSDLVGIVLIVLHDDEARTERSYRTPASIDAVGAGHCVNPRSGSDPEPPHIDGLHPRYLPYRERAIALARDQQKAFPAIADQRHALDVSPYYVGLALAVTAGVAGAAQIAAIKAQQFPGPGAGY